MHSDMRKTRIGILLLLVFLTASACFRDDNFAPGSGSSSAVEVTPSRSVSQEVRRVMILVSAGYNSLSTYLTEDIQELSDGSGLPQGKNRSTDVLMVLSRLPKSTGDYNTESAPVLFRMYKDADGQVVRDTLLRWSGTTPLASTATLAEALEFIRDRFPAKSYGMVFSSHASGWLPVGYYDDPSKFESSLQQQPGSRSLRAWNPAATVFPALDPYPAVKSIGQDKMGTKTASEMELKAFVEAIPMQLDYLLFDACLMGCVEVAYALRDKAAVVGFSQTEVLADGFDYTTIASKLLGPEPNPIAVCRDYYAQYENASDYPCATVSVIYPNKMDQLAAVCKELFAKYRTTIRLLPGNRVQGYFRFDRHYFYDLQDILQKAGMTDAENERLQAALDACIAYKAATPTFLSIQIQRFCGLSMYLPSMGTDFLDGFYRDNMAWNTATQLVL